MFELEISPLSRFQLEHRRILHKKRILNILIPPELCGALLCFLTCAGAGASFPHVLTQESQSPGVT